MRIGLPTCTALLCTLCSLTPRGLEKNMDASLESRIDAMKSAATARTPFSDDELDAAVSALKCLAPEADIDWAALRLLYAERGHLNHKEWAETAASAERLAAILGGPDDAAFRQIFSRVLDGGNWDAAAASASSRPARPASRPATGAGWGTG